MTHPLELGVEKLENRLLLAGNITVTVSNIGDVVIRGDGAANDIEVEDVDGDTFRVVPQDSETINNQPGAQQFDAPTGGFRDLVVDLRGGDDNLGMDLDVQFPFRNARILGGAANDRLEVDGLHLTGNLMMNTGPGTGFQRLSTSTTVIGGNIVQRGAGSNDQFLVSDSDVVGNVSLFGGGGQDALSVTNSGGLNSQTIAGNVLLVGGPGNDGLVLDDFAAGIQRVSGDVRIIGGAGNDNTFVLRTEIEGKVLITSGIGNDTVSLNGATIDGTTSVLAGAGQDTVTVLSQTFGDSAIARLGAGNDQLNFFLNASIDSPFDLFAGSGNDTVDVQDTIFNGPVRMFGGPGLLDQLVDSGGNDVNNGLLVVGFEVSPPA